MHALAVPELRLQSLLSSALPWFFSLFLIWITSEMDYSIQHLRKELVVSDGYFGMSNILDDFYNKQFLEIGGRLG